jgi:hypothetical protein
MLVVVVRVTTAGQIGAAEMVTEHTELDDWPEVDALRMAALPLIQHIFAVTADGSPKRAAAMNEVFAAIERIKQALRPRPTMQ